MGSSAPALQRAHARTDHSDTAYPCGSTAPPPARTPTVAAATAHPPHAAHLPPLPVRGTSSTTGNARSWRHRTGSSRTSESPQLLRLLPAARPTDQTALSD